MRNNLVPEKRLDKHQKLVTRYVKAEGDAPSADLAAVKPTITPKSDPVLSRFADLIADKDNELKLEYLSQESLADMKGIAEHISKESDVSVVWKIMNPMLSNSTNIVVEADIKGVAKHHRLQEGFPLNETLSAVRGLWAYDDNQRWKGNLDEATVQILVDTVSVVLPVLESKPNAYDYPPDGDDGEFAYGLPNFFSFFGGDVEGNGDGALWIRNNDFVDLIKDHVDKAEQIFSIIREREVLSPQMIRAIIETDTPSALLDGAL